MTKLPKFRNKELLDQAFVHRSFLNETKKKVSSNERLEFLGDSVISFVISQYLFITYPNYNEGILTNLRSLLVNTKSLANTAIELNFGDMLMLSKGEEESRGRQNQSLLANCFEAYVGALFLDQGIEATTNFLNEVLIPKTELLVKGKSLKDPKSLLQEKIQSQRQGSPLYKVISESGPAHAKTFTVAVFSNKGQLGVGEGRSKQEAEEKAAEQALNTTASKDIVNKHE